MSDFRLIEEEYEKMVGLTPSLLCISYVDGRFKYANPAFEKILGYRMEELNAINVFQIIHPDDIKRVGEALQHASEQKLETIELEYRYRCKSGEYKWISWNVKIEREDGLVYGAGFDITERKRIEQELEKTSKKLLELNQFAKIGFWEIDVESGEGYWSEGLYYLLGYKRGEFVPGFSQLLNIVHPEDKKLVIAAMKDVEKGQELELDFRIVKKDGSVIWIFEKVGCEFEENGKLKKIHGVVQDITERKLSENRIKESEEMFRDLAENLGEVIWVEQGEKISYINPAYETVYGRTCQSIYEKPGSFLEYVHPDDYEKVNETRNNAGVHTPEPFECQYRIIRPDNEIRWIWTKIFPVVDENNSNVRIIGIGHDITALKQYEESLAQAKDAAEKANKAKSQFLANMSHEIRTPMNGIMGMTDLLIHTSNSEELKEQLQVIKTSSNRLLGIINDILDLAKIDAGKVELMSEPVAVRKKINEDASLFFTLANNKGLELAIQIDEDVPEIVVIDTNRLSQVLMNLIGNAIKFTDHGHINVTVSKSGLVEDKVRLLFSITDTGIGIRKDDIPLLFSSFTQLDDSLTKRYGGTGLGLAISKGLVELMGGEIGVESEFGRGSKFYFTCLAGIWEENLQVMNQGELEVEASEVRRSILLVEDDPVSQSIMIQLGRLKGWTVDVASTGKEALDLEARKDYDLILMDVQMPDMSGLEVSRSIREREQSSGKHVPIIAATAYAMSGDKEKCLDAGMDDYLSKPIEIDEFFRVVEKYCK